MLLLRSGPGPYRRRRDARLWRGGGREDAGVFDDLQGHLEAEVLLTGPGERIVGADPELVQPRVRPDLYHGLAGAPGPGVARAHGEGLVQHVLARPDRHLARPAVVVDRQFLAAGDRVL